MQNAQHSNPTSQRHRNVTQKYSTLPIVILEWHKHAVKNNPKQSNLTAKVCQRWHNVTPMSHESGNEEKQTRSNLTPNFLQDRIRLIGTSILSNNHTRRPAVAVSMHVTLYMILDAQGERGMIRQWSMEAIWISTHDPLDPQWAFMIMDPHGYPMIVNSTICSQRDALGIGGKRLEPWHVQLLLTSVFRLRFLEPWIAPWERWTCLLRG